MSEPKETSRAKRPKLSPEDAAKPKTSKPSFLEKLDEDPNPFFPCAIHQANGNTMDCRVSNLGYIQVTTFFPFKEACQRKLQNGQFVKYTSIDEANRDTGISKKEIRRAVNSASRTRDGCLWSKILVRGD